MIRSPKERAYYHGLLDIVSTEDQQIEFSHLFEQLYRADFEYNPKNRDVDRAKKGIELRHELGFISENKPCSVLEMLVALSIDINGVAGDDREGDRSSLFFWIMLDNLNLDIMDNNHYDFEYVDRCLYVFMNRLYSRNGRGSIFSLENCSKDVRKMEIWDIACRWMNEYLGLN